MSQPVELRTSDGVVFTLEEEHAYKCVFLKNILEATERMGPIEILVDSETIMKIYSFMKTDHHVLKKNYNPLEIYFSSENLMFFEGLPADKLLKVCNAANYLEYYFLLELCCKIIADELSENTRTELTDKIRGKGQMEKDAIGKIQREYEWFDDAL